MSHDSALKLELEPRESENVRTSQMLGHGMTGKREGEGMKWSSIVTDPRHGANLDNTGMMEGR